MTSEEARHYLRNRGRTSCSCKYGSIEKMIEEAIRLKEEEENKKTHL
jgi:hypothetical protein